MLVEEVIEKIKNFNHISKQVNQDPPLPENNASLKDEFMVEIEDDRMSAIMKCLPNKQVIWEDWCKEHPRLIFGHWRRYADNIIIIRTLKNDFNHRVWWDKETYRECDGDFETFTE